MKFSIQEGVVGFYYTTVYRMRHSLMQELVSCKHALFATQGPSSCILSARYFWNASEEE